MSSIVFFLGWVYLTSVTSLESLRSADAIDDYQLRHRDVSFGVPDVRLRNTINSIPPFQINDPNKIKLTVFVQEKSKFISDQAAETLHLGILPKLRGDSTKAEKVLTISNSAESKEKVNVHDQLRFQNAREKTTKPSDVSNTFESVLNTGVLDEIPYFLRDKNLPKIQKHSLGDQFSDIEAEVNNWEKETEFEAHNVSGGELNRRSRLQFENETSNGTSGDFNPPSSSDQTDDLSHQTLQVREGGGSGRGIMERLRYMWGGIPSWSRSKTKGVSPTDVPQIQFYVNKAQTGSSSSSSHKSTASSLNSLEKGLAADRVERRGRDPLSDESSHSSQIAPEHLRPEYNLNPETPYARGLSKYAMSEGGSYAWEDDELDTDEVTSKLKEYQQSHQEYKKRSRKGTLKPKAVGTSKTPRRETSRSSTSSNPNSSSSVSSGAQQTKKQKTRG